MRAILARHLLNVVEDPLEQVQLVLGQGSPTATLKYNHREQSHDENQVYPTWL